MGLSEVQILNPNWKKGLYFAEYWGLFSYPHFPPGLKRKKEPSKTFWECTMSKYCQIVNLQCFNVCCIKSLSAKVLRYSCGSKGGGENHEKNKQKLCMKIVVVRVKLKYYTRRRRGGVWMCDLYQLQWQYCTHSDKSILVHTICSPV